MNVRSLTRRLGLALLITSLLAAVGAGTARAGGGDDKQARELYERAEKSFNVGKFAEALTDYQAAYEAKPLPGFLFNIAQCYRNMGNYERARFFFRRYLAVEPHAPNHRRVEELIAEMSKQIEAQGASGAAASATAPPPADQKPLEQKPAEAKPEEAKSAEAKPAESTTPVEPAAAAVPAAPAPSESSVPLVTAKSSETEESPPVYTRWWFWTGVGAVVVGGAVAAFFLTRPKTSTPGTLDPIDGRP
jgi:tetratricopeptide (TPR) repeat protein